MHAIQIQQLVQDVAAHHSNRPLWLERVEPFMGLDGRPYVTPLEWLADWAQERLLELDGLETWQGWQRASKALGTWLSRQAQYAAQEAVQEPEPLRVGYEASTHELVRAASREAKRLCRKRRNLVLAGPVKDQTDLNGNIVEASEWWAYGFEFVAENAAKLEVLGETAFVSKMATYMVDQKERAEAETPERNEKGGRVRVVPAAIDKVLEVMSA